MEGNNWNSDFWAFEHTPDGPFREPSGDACDHFWRHPEDIRLLAQLGFTSYRFSIEWARIEPEPGRFSRAALDHYRRMLACCHEHGLVPCVTFHHFTSPRWVAADGGWEDMATVDRFARYCERATAHLSDLIGVAATINEANLGAALVASGFFPRRGFRQHPAFAEAARRCGGTPERFGPFLLGDPIKIHDVMLAAHVKARDAIKSASRRRFPLGVTLSMQDYVALPGGERARDAARAQSFDAFLDAARADDFVGVQTYTRSRFGPDGPAGPEPGVPTLIMGYEYWPEALGGTVRYAAQRTGVPIWVTENGIGTDDDTQRIDYISRALGALTACLREGIDVRAYFYWSLLDNFEWLFGYGPRFGLIDVDRTTQRRTAKPSAGFLGRIARANALPAT